MTCARKIGPFDCCSVVQGDCLELMKQLPDGCVDAVITDPPYGVGIASWDLDIDNHWCETLQYILTRNSSLFCFWSVPRIREFPEIPGLVYERILVWSKPMTLSAHRANCTWHWEPIWWWKKGNPVLNECISDVIEVNPPLFRVHPENVAHPTQKPLEIIHRLIDLIDSETILDPFLGSGTTAVAAKKLGRHFLGFEISEEYCRIARERIALVEAQPSLFERKSEQMGLEL